MKQTIKIFQFAYIAISILSVVEAAYSFNYELDFNVIRDLELFGSVNNSHSGVATLFDHTSTSYGAHRLNEQFKILSTDHQELLKRQQVLALLLRDQQSYDALLEHVTSFGVHEKSLGYEWGTFGDTGTQKVIEKFYFDFEVLQGFNTKPTLLDLGNYLKMLGITSPLIEHLILHYAMEYINGHDHHHGHHHHNHFCMADLFPKKFKKILPFIEAVHLVAHLWSFKDMCQDFATQKAVFATLYKQMAHVSVCFKSLHGVYEIIKNNEELGALVDSKSALSLLFEAQDFQDLIMLRDDLLGDYFTCDFYPGMLSPVGQTLSTYKQLQKYLPLIEQACQELGTIDMFVSIATHMKNAEKTDKQFCFVEYIQNAELPVVEFKDMWNVMLGDEAVAADFSFGGDQQVSKVILTGPNKAGKTSYAKTAALNIALAQMFGIAAARQACITPFSQLVSYMIIADDITADQSKFVAGLVRAEKCLEAHKNLEPGQFIFVVLDDSLFEGTTAQRREMASYDFVKQLGVYKNSILLVASHLDVLTTLESETGGKFKNYRMKMYVNEEGKKLSTFILEPGISPQSAVFDIIGDC